MVCAMFAWGVGFIVFFVLIMPVCRYLAHGWNIKRDDIVGHLGDDAKIMYLKMFNIKHEDYGDVSRCYLKVYDKYYGKKYFIWPLILFSCVGLASVYMVIFSVFYSMGYISSPFGAIPGIAIFSLSGAYMWVVYDLTRRSRALDLSPSDISWATFRIVISMPIGYAVASILIPSMAEFVAFGIGACPFSMVMKFMQNRVRSSFGLRGEEASDVGSVMHLQGVNKDIYERLSSEDVNTVPQIAYADPVRLAIRTNLSFNFIIDCMGQALAWLYFENKLVKMRCFGMRGAVEIKHFYDALMGSDVAERKQAEIVLKDISKALGQTPQAVEAAFLQIAEDPFTYFLYSIWTNPVEGED